MRPYNRKSTFRYAEYALYKGDELLTVGTRKELAEYLDVKENTVARLNSRFYKEKQLRPNWLVVYRIEDDTDESEI